jgi:hypothetical protein
MKGALAIKRLPSYCRHVICSSTKRSWGEGWSKRRKLQPQKKAAGQSKQLRLNQQQESELPTDPKDFSAAYARIAKTIEEHFLKNNITSSCIPASILFYEAVKRVNPGEEMTFQLGYIHAPELGICGQHLWVDVREEVVDIGAAILEAAIMQQLGQRVTYEVTKTQPEGAVNLGFDLAARDTPEIAPSLMNKEQEAGILAQISSEAGRALFWSGSPPVLLKVREEVLRMCGPPASTTIEVPSY